VLLGWLHCQHKYLSKVSTYWPLLSPVQLPPPLQSISPDLPPLQYSSAFQERGYGTHQSVCPASTLFWVTPAPRRAWSRRVLADVQQRFADRPIFFMTFSNGGGWRARQAARRPRNPGRCCSSALAGGAAGPRGATRPSPCHAAGAWIFLDMAALMTDEPQ
jgi:hypothetical protein